MVTSPNINMRSFEYQIHSNSAIMKTKLKLTLLLLATSGHILAQEMRLNVQQAQYKDKPVVEMMLNNKKVWVLLDTGSGITILDIKAKNNYGFKTYQKDGLEVPGLGSNNNQLHRATGVVLKFGETQLKSVIFAFDLSNIANSIENRTGKRISGIIGTNMMKTYGFVIDLGNNTVAMHHKIKKRNKKAANKSLVAMTVLKNTTEGN
jgi:hypothetical protein